MLTSQDPWKKCSNLAYAPLKVTVHHSDTGRTTKQTWHLCEHHLNQALSDEMKGYTVIYRNKPHKIATVIGFTILIQ